MKRTDSPDNKPVRDRKRVEGKLIASACQLLTELGPKAVTIRDIAKDAGVNHGQIHHYFGGKQGLLAAAMHKLARDHADYVAQLTKGESSPSLGNPHDNLSPLTLSQNKPYQMAVLRCVLDGEMELAIIELNDRTSIARQLLNDITAKLKEPDQVIDVKAAIAVAMCIEHAWAALDRYILQVVDATPSETEGIRNAVIQESHAMLRRILANVT